MLHYQRVLFFPNMTKVLKVELSSFVKKLFHVDIDEKEKKLITSEINRIFYYFFELTEKMINEIEQN